MPPPSDGISLRLPTQDRSPLAGLALALGWVRSAACIDCRESQTLSGAEALSPESSRSRGQAPTQTPRGQTSALGRARELSEVLTPPIPVSTTLGGLCPLGLVTGQLTRGNGPRMVAPTPRSDRTCQDRWRAEAQGPQGVSLALFVGSEGLSPGTKVHVGFSDSGET